MKKPNPYTTSLTFAASGTAAAVRRGEKTVTRRLVKRETCPWRVGALARAYHKDPRSGAEPFGEVRILKVEKVDLQPIGAHEVRAEGFPLWGPPDFVSFFNQLHGLPQHANPKVWRIVFEVVSLKEQGGRDAGA